MQCTAPRREGNHEEPGEEHREQPQQGMTALWWGELGWSTGTDTGTGGKGRTKGKRKTLSKLTEKIEQRISICSENFQNSYYWGYFPWKHISKDKDDIKSNQGHTIKALFFFWGTEMKSLIAWRFQLKILEIKLMPSGIRRWGYTDFSYE